MPDYEIGAVEIKDAATEHRVGVDSNGRITVNVNGTVPTASAAASASAINYDDIAVDATAGGVSVLAANANRKGALLRNVGTANARVTLDGSTPSATHGLLLKPDEVLTLDQPYCPTGAVKALRSTSTSTTFSRQEIV